MNFLSFILAIFGILGFWAFIIGVWVLWPQIIGAPFVATPKDTIRQMLDLAKVKPTDQVVDLGSGDGRIVVMAAKEYNASSIGVEADPIRVFWSRLKIRLHRLKHKARIIWGNFFSQDLSEATVVTVYQGPDINTRLKAKFDHELKPGTRVVSYSFQFSGWNPVKTTTKPKLYLYII